MAAQNIADNDEDIIDLTELIEKGEVPANEAAVSAGQAEEALSAQLQSLNDLPQQADKEIDALLAQMEVKDDGAPADEAATTRKVDPNEELDMPGMGEVDKLLDTLDIPPQPHEDGAAQAAPGSHADSGSIDSVVDDLLNSMSPAPPAHSGSDQKPDVHELLSAASAPEATGDALPDDLEALLQANSPGANPAAGPSAPRSPEPDLTADLDDLLAAAEKPAPPSGAASPAASKAPDITADLDSLLAAMTAGQDDVPPQPARPRDKARDAETPAAQAVAAPQPAPEAAQAAAAANITETEPELNPEIAQPAAPETAPQSQHEPAADLDSLLAAMTAGQDDAPPQPARPRDKARDAETPAAQAVAAPQPAPEAAQAATAADITETGPELNPEIAQPAAPETAPQNQHEPAADLDSLLAAMTAGQDDAPPQPARPRDKAQDAEPPAAQAVAVPQPAPEAAQAAAAADITETEPEAGLEIAQPAAPETAPKSQHEPAADLDSLLAAMTAGQDMPSSLEDMPLTSHAEEHAAARASEAAHETDAAQASAPHESAHTAADLAEHAAGEEQAFAPEANDELDLDMLLLSPTQQSPGEAHVSEAAPDTAPTCAGPLLDGDAEPLTALDDLLIAALPEQAAQAPADRHAAPIPAKQAPKSQAPQGPEADRATAEELVSLSVRLRHCEAELADARARIAALERASGAAAASLEDLLRDGSPLHDRFAGLIASSVRQAMQSAPAGITEQVLDERLQAVNLSNKSISARMDALETRLDHLEPRFNAQVEKAAAGAAARILREEIATLVQS
ncbi:hypothetical protein [Desulfovibrio sp. ZJ200]|uniref:hypothetical protein n=1 Tax=Desulfovibrio sp. ZJ200 TaxID=2709792 RepID=UPI0013EA3311|nr:hypothetical protein [Desulfovibrio sp. ZJ200]